MLKWAPNEPDDWMKLQKHGSRKVKGKEYFKWTVVIPNEQLEKLRWHEGEELVAETKGDQLILKKNKDG
jgi:hypothetical protein